MEKVRIDIKLAEPDQRLLDAAKKEWQRNRDANPKAKTRCFSWSDVEYYIQDAWKSMPELLARRAGKVGRIQGQGTIMRYRQHLGVGKHYKWQAAGDTIYLTFLTNGWTTIEITRETGNYHVDYPVRFEV